MGKNKDGLVVFKEYLTQPDTPGKNNPPRSIKAEDLDENFRRLTIIPPSSEDKKNTYTVKITPKGTEIEFGSNQDYIVSINGALFSVGFVTVGTPQAL
jgi:hypothetical protein